MLLIETAQDLLQAKIATIGVLEAMRKAGKRLPVQVQVTLQESGTMLLGTEIGAALTALEPFDVDAIGLNCATGPKEMNDAVRYLALNSTKEVSVLPNAGLPQNVGGHAVYKLSPEDLAEYHKHFVKDYGVRIVGGCCGTTPEHLKAVVDAVSGVEPAKRDVKRAGAASSAYTTVPLDLEPKPLIVAEEMNTTTRVEHFRKLVQGKKYDDILALAKKLVNEGSHMLDLCCAIVGEDEKGYITSILEKIATRVPAPILVDSTEADVVEEALKRIPGRAIINSINLEDGEKRTSKVLPMAKRYGAAVIALTIDEDGMALTADKKVAIAHRIYDLATKKYGLDGTDLIFDALTLPISTGPGRVPHRRHRDAESRRAHQERIAAGENNPGREQYFVWSGCLSAPRAELRVHARSGGPWPRHGHRQLHQDLSAVQNSAGRSGTGAQADPPRCQFRRRSLAEVHGAFRRHEGQAGGFDHRARRHALGGRQAEVRDHQRREIRRRWRATRNRWKNCWKRRSRNIRRWS